MKDIKICKKANEWEFFKLLITSRDKDTDEETKFDEMTWKQWINNALKRSHGIFGEGAEYYILNQDSGIAYIKVNYFDKDIFSQAIATYISTDDLIGKPLIVSIEQQTPYITDLEISEDDKLWFKKEMEEINDGSLCD